MSAATPLERRNEAILVAVLAVVPLLPFLGTAFSIDAPVFLAVTRQILVDPLDPFGFEMVWDPTSPAAAVFNRNPPLLSYYLAPFVAIFGESEVALHTALLPFAALAGLAFLGIARRTTGQGWAPACWLVATPAFLVLASTLMLDVPVLALMLLAVYALLRSRDGGGTRWEWLAGAAGAAAGLMKYVGFSIAPLLAAGVVLLLPNRFGAMLRTVGIPLLVWAAWGSYTQHLYGDVHFLGSTDVITDAKKFRPDELWNHLASTFVFYGGALLFPILRWGATLVRGARGIEWCVVGVLLGAAVVTWVLPAGQPPRRVPLDTEEAVLAALGFAGALAMWIGVLRPKRIASDPVEAFAVLWLGGMLVFSAFLNWHVNAADALLAAPPLLILLFRDPSRRPTRRAAIAVVAAMLPFSVLLTWADAEQSNVYRTAARHIVREIGDASGARYFVGHWGLQHYLEREGFRPVVPPMYGRSDLEAGDWVATARNVSQLDVSQNMNEYRLRPVWNLAQRSWLPLRTTNPDAGSGFYSHHSGYVPWAFSEAPIDQVQLGRVVGRRQP
jgi:4-amino-4-deoxy-L-arabinose transferase-like glycosyltransferase